MALSPALLLNREDYRLMPETGPRYQLVEGELIISPAPNRYHQDISRNLEYILLHYLETHPLGKLYHAPFDVYLGEHNVFQPDIAFFSKDRLSALTKEGAEGSPTFVVEILSPKTAKIDRESKRKVFATFGLEELWIIDPVKKTIEVFFLQKDAERPAAVYHDQDTLTSPYFPGLQIRAAEVFKE
jgi:Uma2 family endonuclease